MMRYWATLCVVVFAIVIFADGSACAQTYVLTGTVRDGRTHEPIEGVVVSVVETSMRCETDTVGVFKFTISEPGDYTLSARRIGYAACERIAEVSGRSQVVIELSPITLLADEVIVRSTRVRAGVNTSPIPFAVLTDEDLAQRSALTVSDAMRSIPGVSLVRDGSWETAVSIRGMSRSNIVMLVDNTRIETANDIAAAFSLVDVQELERVETVKSPGSSIWGSGAIGGVVHMMTKKPSFSESSDSHLQFEERAASVNGLLSHHLAFEHSSPRLGFRLGLGVRKAGNTQTPEGAIPNSQFRDMNLSGSVCLKTFDAQTLSLSYQRSQAEDTGIPGGAAIAAAAQARYTMARRELAAAEYSIPEFSKTVDLVTLRVSRQVITRNVEIIQTPTLTLTPHAVHGTTSAQLEGRLQPGTDLTITAGIDAWQRSLDSRRERFNAAKNDVTGERPVPASTYLSGGSYMHGVWKAAPDLVTIDAGARYDWIRVNNESTFNPEYVISSAGIPNLHPSGQLLLWNEQTVNNHSWSADAGVTLALSPDADLSCLAATAFRSPSLEERFQYLDLGSLVRVGSPLLLPEQSLSLNVGFSLHRGRTAVRADLFVNQFTDLVTEIPGTFMGRSALIKTNIGKALMYGGEIGGDIPLFAWASAQYSLAYVYGEDTRAHAPLPQIPPLTGGVTLNALLASVGIFSIDLSYAFRQDRLAQGEPEAPGYALAGAGFSSAALDLPFLTRQGASCTVRAGVENIFDLLYRTHLSTLRGVIRREPGRNLYVSLALSL